MEPDVPILVHRSFTDFEQLMQETKAWNFDFSKLDTDPFSADLFQLISSDLVIGRGRFGGRLKQLGQTPVGFRTFTIPTFSDFWMYWRGYEVDGANLMAFPLNGELDTVSDPHFDVYTISISEQTLFETAAKLGYSKLKSLLASHEVLQCDPACMERLRRCLHQCETESRLPAPNAETMKSRLVVRLAEALGSMTGHRFNPKASARRINAIRATDRFIMEHPDEIPSIKELCRVAQVSERTLEYAFAEYYGMRPKVYINAMRLNGARRELRSNRSVSDAANAWGFWHMGQFAADYRKLFGELPSKTRPMPV